ncbi:MAG: 6-hydroxymethylpterin diphosphokinase MptE-like protein [Methanomicrobiales archaeon]
MIKNKNSFMEINTWFSWYKKILKDFGFSKKDDEQSARLLSELLEDKTVLNPENLHIKKNVLVFGAGPSIKKNIDEIKKIDIDSFTIISADGATTALLEEDIIPDIIVTDLDGKIEDIIKANQLGSVLVVHAHGNNEEKIKKYAPIIKNLIGSTQSNPLKNVYNFGGFTDGDRCVFLAIELNAKLIILAGMDFGDVVTNYSRPELNKEKALADEIKKLKLEYAKKLIEWAAANEKVKIVNISYGEVLKGVSNTSLDKLDLNIKS